MAVKTSSKASASTAPREPKVPNLPRDATRASGPERAAPTKPKLPRRHRASAPDEFKTSMLNIRVKDDLKRQASATLEGIGISLPEAVRVFLGRVVSEQAFPFPLEVPNAEMAAALRESLGSRRTRHTSVEEMFDALEKGGRR